MSIKISIIIPMYNGEKYIENTIKKLLSQTCSFHELIIVDDGSTDNSFKICKQYAEKNSNIKLIHTENRGSGPARMTGVQNATGDYLYFPDADDDLACNLIETVQFYLEKNFVDLLVFGYVTIYPDGEKEEKRYTSYSIEGSSARKDYSRFCSMESEYGIQGAPWNKVFKRSIIIENDIVFPTLRRHQDEAFISSYVNYVESIRFIPDVLYTYYANDPNLEWRKFPADYENAVLGLIKNRKETVLQWNCEDKETHMIIGQQLFCRSVKACENLFSPKQSNITKDNICKKIEEFLDVLYFSECPDEVRSRLGTYHRFVFKLSKEKKVKLLFYIFKLKYLIDNNYYIRKILRRYMRSKV